MKCLLLVVVLFGCGVVQAQQETTSKYDRFTDETTVTLRYFHPIKPEEQFRRNLNLQLSYTYSGNGATIEPPKDVFFSFIVAGGISDYDSSTELYVLADGKRYHFPRLEADFGSQTLVRIPIPFQQLEELIQRQNVEMRLGNVELAFSGDDIKKIRSFLPQRKIPSP